MKRLGYISHEKTAPAPVGPLLHCVVKSPAGRYAASLELVGGVIFIYDCENQYQIVWKERMPKGADPRHLCFSRDGRFLYVNHQGDEKVSVYHFNPEAEKKLFHLQTLSVKGEDGIGKTEPAAIRLSPDGRLLAVSSRGMGTEHREDLITLFDVNQQEGTLSLKQAVRTGGQMPRDFNFTPDGKFLVTGYQFQSYLDLYQVTENGLVFISSSDVLPSPVCIAF